MVENDELKYRVEQKLKNDPRLQNCEIGVEVYNQKVILKGFVGSIHAYETLQQDVWSTRGVRGIENNVKVQFPESYTRPTDDAIRNSIHGLITTNPEIFLERIAVEVREGKVTITGSVDQYYKKTIARHCVQIVGGVTSMVDMLTITPTRSSSDETIGRAILTTLKRNSIVDVNLISIEVKNGNVILTGMVPGMDVFEIVEDIVRYTEGVTQIENHMNVGISSQDRGS